MTWFTLNLTGHRGRGWGWRWWARKGFLWRRLIQWRWRRWGWGGRWCEHIGLYTIKIDALMIAHLHCIFVFWFSVIRRMMKKKMTMKKMTTMRQKTRKTNQKTAAASRIHNHQILSQTENRRTSFRGELSSAELSQESRELCHCANPALLPPPEGAPALPHPFHTHLHIMLQHWWFKFREVSHPYLLFLCFISLVIGWSSHRLRRPTGLIMTRTFLTHRFVVKG